MVGQRAGQSQHHHLVGAGIAAHPQLGIQSSLRGQAISGDDHDHPARMLTAGPVGRLDRLLKHRFGIGGDDQRQHPAEGDRTALFAQSDDLLVDRPGIGLGQIDNHGRLHSRPDRRSISKEDSGPQVPDS